MKKGQQVARAAIVGVAEYEETATLDRPTLSVLRCSLMDRVLLWTRAMTFLSDPLVHQVIGCAIAVHRELGPGLLESSYSRCFRAEPAYHGLAFRTEVGVHLVYRDLRIDNA